MPHGIASKSTDARRLGYESGHNPTPRIWQGAPSDDIEPTAGASCGERSKGATALELVGSGGLDMARLKAGHWRWGYHE